MRQNKKASADAPGKTQAANGNRAVDEAARALADRERALGADHPNTLAARNNLAHAYRAAGRLDDAIPLIEENLAACVRVLGEDHPQALTSRKNVAAAYKAAGHVGAVLDGDLS